MYLVLSEIAIVGCPRVLNAKIKLFANVLESCWMPPQHPHFRTFIPQAAFPRPCLNAHLYLQAETAVFQLWMLQVCLFFIVGTYYTNTHVSEACQLTLTSQCGE
jgi:hypothetical protein